MIQILDWFNFPFQEMLGFFAENELAKNAKVKVGNKSRKMCDVKVHSNLKVSPRFRDFASLSFPHCFLNNPIFLVKIFGALSLPFFAEKFCPENTVLSEDLVT